MQNTIKFYLKFCYADENRPSLFANVDIASPILEEPEEVIVMIDDLLLT